MLLYQVSAPSLLSTGGSGIFLAVSVGRSVSSCEARRLHAERGLFRCVLGKSAAFLVDSEVIPKAAGNSLKIFSYEWIARTTDNKSEKQIYWEFCTSASAGRIH